MSDPCGDKNHPRTEEGSMKRRVGMSKPIREHWRRTKFKRAAERRTKAVLEAIRMGFFIGLPVGVAVELLRIRMFGNPWE